MEEYKKISTGYLTKKSLIPLIILTSALMILQMPSLATSDTSNN